MSQPEYTEVLEKTFQQCQTKDFLELAVELEQLCKAVIALHDTSTKITGSIQELVVSLREQV